MDLGKDEKKNNNKSFKLNMVNCFFIYYTNLCKFQISKKLNQSSIKFTQVYRLIDNLIYQVDSIISLIKLNS